MADFFGFEINRKGKAQLEPVSIVPSTDADGAGVINSGGHFGAYLDLDADKAQNEVEQLLKYRDIASQPECDAAIEDIVNEAIVGDHNESPVNIILDKLQVSDKVKTIVREEFMNVLSLMQFNSYSENGILMVGYHIMLLLMKKIQKAVLENLDILIHFN